MAMITMKNIEKKFGEKVIFNRFDMNVEAGEFVSIMG